MMTSGNNESRSGLAQSHPAHLQAVQEVASGFGGQPGAGAVDMWPLQLLEFADRVRKGGSISLQQPPVQQHQSYTPSAPSPAHRLASAPAPSFSPHQQQVANL
jgi:hypothetical protein